MTYSLCINPPVEYVKRLVENGHEVYAVLTPDHLEEVVAQAMQRDGLENTAYEVIKDSKDQYLILCAVNNHCVGLTWADNTTLNLHAIIHNDN